MQSLLEEYSDLDERVVKIEEIISKFDNGEITICTSQERHREAVFVDRRDRGRSAFMRINFEFTEKGIQAEKERYRQEWEKAPNDVPYECEVEDEDFDRIHHIDIRLGLNIVINNMRDQLKILKDRRDQVWEQIQNIK